MWFLCAEIPTKYFFHVNENITSVTNPLVTIRHAVMYVNINICFKGKEIQIRWKTYPYKLFQGLVFISKVVIYLKSTCMRVTITPFEDYLDAILWMRVTTWLLRVVFCRRSSCQYSTPHGLLTQRCYSCDWPLVERSSLHIALIPRHSLKKKTQRVGGRQVDCEIMFW